MAESPAPRRAAEPDDVATDADARTHGAATDADARTHDAATDADARTHDAATDADARTHDAASDADARRITPAPRPDGRLRPAVAVAALLLLVGTRVLDVLLASQAMAALVAQVVLVEWGAGKLDVTWTAIPLGGRHLAGRVARGAGLGLAGAVAIVGLALVTRSLEIERVTNVPIAMLVLGLLGAGLAAWRDELLLHGLTLRAVGARLDPVARVLACLATSAGAALGRSDATPRTVVVGALLGALYGALWVRERGGYAAWAAHAAFRFTTGTLIAGGLLQTRVAADAFGGGDAGLLGGTAAVLALLPLASAAIVLTARAAAGNSSSRANLR